MRTALCVASLTCCAWAQQQQQQQQQQQHQQQHQQQQQQQQQLDPSACSREDSRQIRSFVQREILSKVDVSAMGDKCILNPKFDMFKEQESMKQERNRREWQCAICDKRFVNEFYLDRHLNNKHSSTIPPNATVCLGDLCPIFGCSTIASNGGKARRAMREHAFSQITKCTEAEVEKARYKCEVIARRCDNDNNDSSSDKPSTGELVRNTCRQLKCVNGVLQGHPALQWRQKSDDDDLEDWTLLWTVLKFMLCVAVCLVLAACYTPDASKTVMRLLGYQGGTKKGSSSKEGTNFLSRAEANKKKRSGVLGNILDSFSKVRRQLSGGAEHRS